MLNSDQLLVFLFVIGLNMYCENFTILTFNLTSGGAYEKEYFYINCPFWS